MATSRQPTSSFTESNEVLKQKCRSLHTTIVTALSGSMGSIVAFLFQQRVIGAEELWSYQMMKTQPLDGSRDLLTQLHRSKNPQAFVQLYLAMKNESQLDWLVDQINHFADQSLVSLLQQMYISKPTVGDVVHCLREGEPVWGVASLAGLLYVLRGIKSTEHIEVYDIDSYSLKKHITVPGLDSKAGIIACAHNQCLYVSGARDKCVHKVGLLADAGTTQWPVGDVAGKLSLTNTHGVLVTCREVGKIKEFSTDGTLLREVQLSSDVVSPRHTIQLSNGQLVVIHGDATDPVHRVCLAGSYGHVVKSFGGRPGSGRKRMNLPLHCAVDKNGFVFVADYKNCRVLLLSPALIYVRDIVSRDQLKWKPLRLCLDVDRRLLYIADCEWKDGEYVTGRVVVVSV